MDNSGAWGLDWMVSVDDHVFEPVDLWQSRVPAAVKDLAPRRVVDGEGEAWIYDGKRYPTYGLGASAGKNAEEFSPEPLTYDQMRPSCYDARARIEDMDKDHVIASLCFPSFPRFAGQLFSLTPNRELGMACIQAYNDWMLEEWAAAAPGRLIPLMIAPMWDAELAAAEVLRCAGKGAKAMAFSENPEALGFPSIHNIGYWDPLFSAVNDTGLPVCTHIGSSSRILQPSSDTPSMGNLTYFVVAACAGTLTDWLFGGHFLRYPNLKLCLSEGGIGWIPYVLERAETVYDKQRHWYLRLQHGSMDASKVALGGGDKHGVETNPHALAVLESGLRPTELFREHVYGCFFDDKAGVALIDSIGIDNVMVESDYPHSDSNWPNTMKVIAPQLQHLNDEAKRKVLQSNALRLFDFVPAPPPAAP